MQESRLYTGLLLKSYHFGWGLSTGLAFVQQKRSIIHRSISEKLITF